MKVFALRVAVTAVRVLAALVELFVQRDERIVFISCQSNQPTQDMLDLAETARALPGAPDVQVMAGLMRRSAGGAFSFLGTMFSMLRQIAAASVVVIDAYCPAVSIPGKRPEQMVVQIWHAPEAIKKFSLQILDTQAGYSGRTAMILKMHRGYDHILCPSEATRPFFMEAFGYPESAFVKYGLPSLDRLGLMKRPLPGETESPQRTAKRAAVYQCYPALAQAGQDRLQRPLTIVYAPTFRDGAAVDAAGLTRAFAHAAEEAGVSLALVLKLHPLDAVKGSGEGSVATAVGLAGAQAAQDRGRFQVIMDTDFPLIDWYAVADVIVTDYSGVAVEAAAAGVACYYYLYDADDYAARRGLNVDLRREAVAKYAFADAASLAAQALRDFGNADSDFDPHYDYDALAVFAHKYIEAPLAGNTEKLIAFITKDLVPQ